MATEMQKSYKFDTKVQHLKYKVLREVARLAWNDRLMENVMDIPKMIVPGNTPTMRCCVYKERAILGERVKLAMGGNKDNPNIIEVIESACDECPMGGYEVTNAGRGCLAHRCEVPAASALSRRTSIMSLTSTRVSARSAVLVQRSAPTPLSSAVSVPARMPARSRLYI